MEQNIIDIIKGSEDSAASVLQLFEGFESSEHTTQDLEDRTKNLLNLQEIAFLRLQEKGLTKEIILNLRKEDYPSIFRFFRLRCFENLIPSKIED
jgi:hypothetical protein